MSTLTDNERHVVITILNWGGGSIWTECLQDECRIAPRSIPGVIASLSKKGIATVNGNGRDSTVDLVDPDAAARLAGL